MPFLMMALTCASNLFDDGAGGSFSSRPESEEEASSSCTTATYAVSHNTIAGDVTGTIANAPGYAVALPTQTPTTSHQGHTPALIRASLNFYDTSCSIV